MPLFDFICPFHGPFELLLKEAPKGKRSCPICKTRSEIAAPLTVMRPDALWAGHYLENFGYVTSSSQVAQIRKNRHLVEIGDRSDVEGMKKTADDAAKAKREQFAKETRAFIEEEFTGKGMLDSFGDVTPEANRPLSDKPLTSTKDERLKS